MLTFYAELLSNIRAITLSIHLSSPATASTRITVEPSASAAILHHHGESIRLPLPGNVNPEHQQRQYGTTVGTEHLSCRLEVAPPPPPKGENYAPWSAPELTRTESASFDCRKCGSTLIPRKRVKKWKDLPSGNWADMMDFWHCHKPDDDRKKKDEAEEGESAKYSTFGKGFAVERGTGLVDRLYFLLPADDCENVQVSQSILLLRIDCSFVAVSASKLSIVCPPAMYLLGKKKVPNCLSGCMLIGCGNRYNFPRLNPDGSLSRLCGWRCPHVSALMDLDAREQMVNYCLRLGLISVAAFEPPHFNMLSLDIWQCALFWEVHTDVDSFTDCRRKTEMFIV